MAILKNRTQSNFTMINNIVFRDQDLKLIDRGLLSTIISLPDGWDFNVKGLAQIVPDGKDAIKASLKRLKEKGYLRSYQSRDKNGTLGSNIIEVFPDIDAETPENTAFQPWAENPLTVNPLTDNPLTDNPRADNPQQYNTITIENKKIKNESIKKETKNNVDVVVNNTSPEKFSDSQERPTLTDIKKQISYNELIKDFPDKGELIDLIVDVMSTDENDFHGIRKNHLVGIIKKAPPLNTVNSPYKYIRQSLYNALEEIFFLPIKPEIRKTGFHNFTERSYDYEELERIALNS